MEESKTTVAAAKAKARAAKIEATKAAKDAAWEVKAAAAEARVDEVFAAKAREAEAAKQASLKIEAARVARLNEGQGCFAQLGDLIEGLFTLAAGLALAVFAIVMFFRFIKWMWAMA